MPIITLAEAKEQLSFTDDMGDVDDDLLTRKVAAAQNHIERLLGYKIEEQFGGAEQEPVPPALAEAVAQLAALWYEVREGAMLGGAAHPLPFGISEIVTEYREFTF